MPLLQPPVATDFLGVFQPRLLVSLLLFQHACNPFPELTPHVSSFSYGNTPYCYQTVSVTYFCLTNHPEIYLLKNRSIIYSVICAGLGWALLLVSLGVIHATADVETAEA